MSGQDTLTSLSSKTHGQSSARARTSDRQGQDDPVVVRDVGTAVAQALARAALEPAEPWGLSGYFAAAASVLSALAQKSAELDQADFDALNQAWLTAADRVKGFLPNQLTSTDKLAIAAMERHGYAAWDALGSVVTTSADKES